MSKNTKKTSKAVASKAAKILTVPNMIIDHVM